MAKTKGRRVALCIVAALAVAAIIVGIVAVVRFSGMSKIDELPETDVASYNEAALHWVDTDILEYRDYEETQLTDERIFAQTTIWDLKSRIVPKVEVRKASGRATIDLRPNEFHISFTVNGVQYNDVDNDLQTTPFQGDGVAISGGEGTEVTVTLLTEAESGIEGGDYINSDAGYVADMKATVKFSEDAPQYQVGSLKGSFPNELEKARGNNNLYTNTGLRTYNIYSFDYRASITAIPTSGKGEEDREEIPREFIDLSFESGAGRFEKGQNTVPNNIKVYVKGQASVTCTMTDLTAIDPTTKQVWIGINEEKVRRATETSSVYYRRDGEGVPAPLSQSDYHNSGYVGPDGIRRTYYAFIAGMDVALLKYNLYVTVYDNNGGSRILDDEERVNPDIVGFYTDAKGTTYGVPTSIVNGAEYPIQITFKDSGNIENISNQIEIPFYNASIIHYDITYLQETGSKDNFIPAIDEDGKKATGELLNPMYPSDFNGNDEVINILRSHGQLNIKQVYYDGRIANTDASQHYTISKYYTTPAMYSVEGTAWGETEKDSDGKTLVDENKQTIYKKKQEEYLDGTYIRYLNLGSTYFPVRFAYEKITDVEITGSANVQAINTAFSLDHNGDNVLKLDWTLQKQTGETVKLNDSNALRFTGFVNNAVTYPALEKKIDTKSVWFYRPIITYSRHSEGGIGYMTTYYYTDHSDGLETPRGWDIQGGKYAHKDLNTHAIDFDDLGGEDVYTLFESDTDPATSKYYSTLKRAVTTVRFLYIIDELKDGEGNVIQPKVAVYRDFEIIDPTMTEVNYYISTNYTNAKYDILRYTYLTSYGSEMGAEILFGGFTDLTNLYPKDPSKTDDRAEVTVHFEKQDVYGNWKKVSTFTPDPDQPWLTQDAEKNWRGEWKYWSESAGNYVSYADSDWNGELQIEIRKSRSTTNHYIVVMGDGSVGLFRMYLDLNIDGNYRWKTTENGFHPVEDAEGGQRFHCYWEFTVTGQAGTLKVYIDQAPFNGEFKYLIEFCAGDDILFAFTNKTAEELKAAEHEDAIDKVVKAPGSEISDKGGDRTTNRYRIGFESNGKYYDEGYVPKDPGTYTTYVYVWSHGIYGEASTTADFTISRRELQAVWKAGVDHNNAIWKEGGLDPLDYVDVVDLSADKTPYERQTEGLDYANWEIQYAQSLADNEIPVGSAVGKLEYAREYSLRIRLHDNVMGSYAWSDESLETKNKGGIATSYGQQEMTFTFVVKQYTGNTITPTLDNWQAEDQVDEGIFGNRTYNRGELVDGATEKSATYYGAEHVIYITESDYIELHAKYEQYLADNAEYERAKAAEEPTDSLPHHDLTQGFYSVIHTEKPAAIIYKETLNAQKAGKYYAIAYTEYKISGSHTKLDDAFRNYNYAEGIKEFEIRKLVVETPSLAKAEGGKYVYTGSKQIINIEKFNALGGTTTSNGSTVKFCSEHSSSQLETSEQFGTVTAKDAGVYELWLELIDTENLAWKEFEETDSAVLKDYEGIRHLVLTLIIYRKAIDPEVTKNPFKPNVLTYIYNTAQAATYKVDDDKPSVRYNDGTDKTLEGYGLVLDTTKGGTQEETNAGKYTLYLKARDNYYIKGSGAYAEGLDEPNDETLAHPKAEQPSYPVEWVIKPQEINNFRILPNGGTTYNGERLQFNVEGYDDNIMTRVLNGKSATGAAFQTATGDTSAHYHENYESSVGGSVLRLYATYAGDYALTVTFKPGYTGNYYWSGDVQDGEGNYPDSHDFTFKIDRAVIALDWAHGQAEGFGFVFTFAAGKARELFPIVTNAFGDSFTLSPKYYSYTDNTKGALLDEPPIAAGRYLAAITRADITGKKVSERTKYPATYKEDNEEEFYILDNYYMLAGSVDGELTQSFGIRESSIDIPTLVKGASGAELGTHIRNEDTIIVNYTGAAFDFGHYLNDWADGDKWNRFLTATAKALGEEWESGLLFTDVLWQAGARVVEYYEITVEITDKDNYSWASEGGKSYAATDTFTFFMKINPKQITLPDIIGKTYETDYTDGNHAFTEAIPGFAATYGEGDESLISVFETGKETTTGEENVNILESAVAPYSVTVRINDKNNYIWKVTETDPLTALDSDDKQFGFQINPVAIKAEWSEDEATFDGSEKTLKAKIANEFNGKATSDEVTIAFELSVKTETEGDDSATISGDKAKNAGYYLATIIELTGADAKNYVIEKSGVANVTKTHDFTIFKKAIAAPDAISDKKTYNRFQQEFTFSGEAALLTIVDMSAAADGVPGDVIPLGTFGHDQLKIYAIHAGTYSIKIALEDFGNYYFRKTPQADFTEEAASLKLPSSDKQAEAEYSWTIDKKTLEVPSLQGQRAKTLEAGKAFYPDAAKDDSVTLVSESESEITYNKTVADGWVVLFTLEYFDGKDAVESVAATKIADLKDNKKSVDVGDYHIKIHVTAATLAAIENGLPTDYEWGNPADFSLESREITENGINNNAYTREENDLVARLYYRILRGTYDLSFTLVKADDETDTEVDGWTYGDLVKQEKNGVAGTLQIAFLREMPTTPTGFQQEMERRSVTYYRVEDGENVQVEEEFLVDNLVGIADTAERYVPDKAPYLAGEYIARIHYEPNGDGAGNGDYTVDEKNIDVSFEIKKLGFVAEWGENGFTYNGGGYMTSATVDNIVTTELASGKKIDEVNLTVVWSSSDRKGETQIDGKPVDVRRTRHGETVGAYRTEISAFSGADSDNYRMLTNDEGGYNYNKDMYINPAKVTLTADAQSHVFGDKTRVGRGNSIAKDGDNFKFGITDGKFIEEGDKHFEFFDVYAVSYSSDPKTTEYLRYDSPVTPVEGGYYTRLSIQEAHLADFKNYDITFVDGAFTVEPMEVTVIWSAFGSSVETFTFDGKDAVKQYSATHDGKKFLYFIGIDEKEVEVVPTVTGRADTVVAGADKFIHAGTYDFTIDVAVTNKAILGDGANYVLAAASGSNILEREFTMNKRTVTLMPNGFTTQYSKLPTAADLKWLYADGTTDEHKFVDGTGKVLEWKAGITIPDGISATPLKFATYTSLTKTDHAGSHVNTILVVDGTSEPLKVRDDTSYCDYIIATAENKADGITAAQHFIDYLTVDVLWDANEDGEIVFVYDGTDRTYANGVSGSTREQMAYFLDENGEKQFLPVFAVREKLTTGGSPARIAFVDANAEGEYYTVYVEGIGEERSNYQLRAGRYYFEKVKILPRDVTITVDEDLSFTYGNMPDFSKRFSTGSDPLHEFVNGYGENFTLATEVVYNSAAKMYENAFKLVCADGDIGSGVDFHVGGANARNYHVTFVNGNLEVLKRTLDVEIENVTRKYGEKIENVFSISSTTIKHDGGEPYAVGDVADKVLKIYALVDGKDILSSAVYPNVGEYSIYVKLLSENYVLNVTTSGNIDVSEANRETDSGAKYIIEASDSLVTSAKLTAYNATDGVKTSSAKYDGAEHEALKALSATYYTNGVQSGAGVKASIAKGTAPEGAANNRIIVLFRNFGGVYDEDLYKSSTFGAPEVNKGGEKISVTDAGYEWTTAIPKFTHVGKYYVYYAILADNHTDVIGESYRLEIEITKTQLTVSTSFEAYYGEDAASYKPEYSFVGLLGADSGDITRAKGYSDCIDNIIMTIDGFVRGESEASEDGKEYNVTLDITDLQNHLADYEVTTAKSTFTLYRLPITVTVLPLSDVYYADAAVGTKSLHDLQKLGEAFNIAVNVTSKLDNITPIEDIYDGDYEDETHVLIFKLVSEARPDGKVTGVVGKHDITLTLNEGYDNKYDVSWTGKDDGEYSQYTIDPAQIKQETVHAYGGVGTSAYDYDEKQHYALHYGGAHPAAGDLAGEAAYADVKKFAKTANSEITIKWTFYVFRSVEKSAYDNQFNTPEFWTTHDAETSTSVPLIIDAGYYIVYYRMEADNHTTAYGYKEGKIDKVDNELSEYSLGLKDGGRNVAWTYGEYDATTNAETLPQPKFDKKADGKAKGEDNRIVPTIILRRRDIGSSGAYVLYDAFKPTTDPETYYAGYEGWFATANNGKTLPAGEYEIEYYMAETENYNEVRGISTVKFTVEKKVLDFTARNFEVSYGDDLSGHEFGFDVKGFVLSDNYSKIFSDTKPKFEVRKGRGEGSPLYANNYANGSVGEYDIIMSLSAEMIARLAIEAKNYTPKFGTEAKMTVVQRKITIEIKNQTNRYDFNRSELNERDEQINVEDVAWEKAKSGLWQYAADSLHIVESDYAGKREDYFAKSNPIFELFTDALEFGGDGKATTTKSVKDGNYAIWGAKKVVTDGNDYAKNYDVEFKGEWSGDTAHSAGEAGVYTIEPALLTLTIVDPADLVYDGQVKKYENPKVVGEESVTFTVSYEKFNDPDWSAIEQVVDAGKYRVSFTTESVNYVAAEAQREFTVYPKSVVISAQLYKKDGEETIATPDHGNYYSYFGGEYYFKTEYSVQPAQGTDPNDGLVVYGEELTILIKYTHTVNRGSHEETENPIHFGDYTASFSSADGNYKLVAKIGDDVTFADKSFSIMQKELESVTFAGDKTEDHKPYDGKETFLGVANYLADTDERVNGKSIMKVTFKLNGVENSENTNLGNPDEFWKVRNVGTYTITFELQPSTTYGIHDYVFNSDDDGYSITLTYTINKRNLYVRVKETEIVFGEEFDEEYILAMTLEYSRNDLSYFTDDSAFDGGDTALDALNTEGRAFTTSMRGGSGEYSVTAAANTEFYININDNSITSDNYNVLLRAGALKVIPRPITLTIDSSSATSVYDGQNPQVTDPMKYLSLKDGSALNSAVDKSLAELKGIKFLVEGTAEDPRDITHVGSHRMTPDADGATNYAVTFEGDWNGGDEFDNAAGTWKITRKQLNLSVGIKVSGVLTMSGATLVYGEDVTKYYSYEIAAGDLAVGDGKIDVKEPLQFKATLTGDSKPYSVGNSIAGEEYDITIENALIDLFDDYNVTLKTSKMKVVSRAIDVTVEDNEFFTLDDRADAFTDIPAVPQFTDYIDGFLPQIVESGLTYTGTLHDKTPFVGKIPQRVGEYEVTITLKQNAIGQYDYVLKQGGNSETATLEYNVLPKKIMVGWQSDPLDLGEAVGLDHTMYNPLTGFRSDIMSLEYSFNSVPAQEKWDDALGRATVTEVGGASGNLKLKDNYTDDYILVNGIVEATSIILTFHVQTSSVDFRVEIEDWEYNAGQSANEPKPASSVIADFSDATIVYEYVFLGKYGEMKGVQSVGEYWQSRLEKLSEAESREEVLAELAKLHFTQLAPVNAGYWMVRAKLSAMQDYTAATAYSVFEINKAKRTPLTLIRDDDSYVYNKEKHAVHIGTNYDGDIIRIDYAGEVSITDDNIIGDSAKFYGTDAAIYTITASLYHSDNYEWNLEGFEQVKTGGWQSYIEGDVLTLTWEVEKATAEIVGADSDTTINTVYGTPYGMDGYLFPTTSEFGEVTYAFEKDGVRNSETPTNAGTYTVYANVAADDNWNAAEEVTFTLVIAKAKLSVNARDGEVVYGEEVSDYGFTVSGYVYGDQDKPECEVPSSAVTYTYLHMGAAYRPGSSVKETFEITAVIGSAELANYDVVAGTSGTLTVKPRRIKIAVDGFSVQYTGVEEVFGTEVYDRETGRGLHFAVDTTESGYYSVFGEDVIAVKLTKQPGTDVGSVYTVSGTADNDYAGNSHENYEMEFADGACTITQLVVTVKANSLNVSGGLTYNHGDAVDMAISYTLIINGEEVAHDSSDNELYNRIKSWITFAFTGSEDGGTPYMGGSVPPVNAGAYRVSLVVKPEGGRNVSIDSESELFVISKYHLDKEDLQEYFDSLDYTYDGKTAFGPEKADILAQSEKIYGKSDLFTVVDFEKQIAAGSYPVIATLADPNNYRWAQGGEAISIAVTDFRYTVKALEKKDLSLTIELSGDGEWQYNSTLLFEEFRLVSSVEALAESELIRFYVTTAEDKPTFDMNDHAGWYEFTREKLHEEANRATYVGKHWIVAVLPETESYVAVQSDVVGYTVTKRQVVRVINNGEDFLAGTYAPGLRGIDLLRPTGEWRLVENDLPDGVTIDSLMKDISEDYSLKGTSFAGNEFNLNAVEAGKYEYDISVTSAVRGMLDNFDFTIADGRYLPNTDAGYYIVNRAPVYASSIIINSIPYDGDSHKPSDALGENPRYNTVWTIDPDNRYESGAAQAITVGNYRFNAIILDVNNYFWDGTGEASADSVTKEFELSFNIVKSAITSVRFDRFLHNNLTKGEGITTTEKGGTATWTYLDEIADINADVTVFTSTGEVEKHADREVTVNVEFRSKSGGSWTTTVPAEAGIYEVRVTVSGGMNFLNSMSSSADITVEVEKFLLDKPTLEERSGGWTYDGNIQTAIVNGFDVERMGVAHSDESWNFIVNEDGGRNTATLLATNAGVYTIEFTVRDAKNFAFRDSDTTITWTISVAENNIVFTTGTVTYGDEYELSAVADSGTPTFSYAVKGTLPAEEETYQPGKPLHAGTYYIKVVAETGDDNYRDVTKYFEFTIEKAVLSIKIADMGIIYGEEATIGKATIEGLQYSDDIEFAPALYCGYDLSDYETRKAADYRITIADKAEIANFEHNDYKLADGSEDVYGVLTVRPRKATITLKSQRREFVPGGLLPDLDASKDVGWTGEDFLFDDLESGELIIIPGVSGENVFFGAGAYILEATLGGARAESYDFGFISDNLLITAKTVVIDSFDIPNTIYGDEYDAKAEIDGATYASGEGIFDVTLNVRFFVGTEEIEKPTNAGSYNAVVELVGDNARYYLLTGATVKTFAVMKRQLSVEAARETANNQTSEVTVEAEGALFGTKITRYHFKPTYTGEEISVSEEDLDSFVAAMRNLEGFLLENDRAYAPFTAYSESGVVTGFYNVYLTLSEEIAANYVWDETGTEMASIRFEIIKATLYVDGGSPAESFVYNGMDRAEGFFEDRFIFLKDGKPYPLRSEAYTLLWMNESGRREIAAIDAGKYIPIFTLSGEAASNIVIPENTDRYSFDGATLIWNYPMIYIGKAALTVYGIGLKEKSREYNASDDVTELLDLSEMWVEGAVYGEEVPISVAGTLLTPVAGDHRVQIAITTDSPNYEISASSQNYLTGFVVEPRKVRLEVDSTINAVTTYDFLQGDDVRFNFERISGDVPSMAAYGIKAAAPSKAGEDLVAVTLVGDDAKNYTLVDDAGLKVSSLTITGTIPGLARNSWERFFFRDDWYAGDQPSEVVNARATYGGEAKVRYYTDMECTQEIAEADLANAPVGTYYARYEIASGETYDGLVSLFSFRILEKPDQTPHGVAALADRLGIDVVLLIALIVIACIIIFITVVAIAFSISDVRK